MHCIGRMHGQTVWLTMHCPCCCCWHR
jgi:hypothetical protein